MGRWPAFGLEGGTGAADLSRHGCAAIRHGGCASLAAGCKVDRCSLLSSAVTERLRPKDRWARTVLGDDAKVATLIGRSTSRLTELPRLRAALLHALNGSQWFVVCSLCSIIGELMFAAFDPKQRDKFPKLAELRIPASKHRARHKQRGQKRDEKYYLVAALRHTCFHPAMSAPIRDLPRDIFTAMQSLHSEAAADWSLAQLDEALQFELRP